jgi:hypothetical protein
MPEDLEILLPEWKAALLNFVIPCRECEADLPEDLEIPPPDSKAALLNYCYSVQGV